MKFGIAFANTGPFGTVPENARALAGAVEEVGIESLWTVEHVVVPQGYASQYPYDKSGRMPGGEDSPIPDPLIWLSHMSALTSTVKLATGILILPQRNPLVVAKELATLDRLSGGRLLLGVGAGWLEEEFDALGIPFADRGRRLDDYVGALRAAWGEQPASHDGEFVQFPKVYVEPRPVAGSVPVIVGGHTHAAARRAGRLGDGFFPGRGRDEDLVGLMATMRAAAEEAGRDPSAIEVTASGFALLGPDPLAAVEHYASLGISRLVIPPLTYNPTDLPSVLTDFADRVIRPST